MIEEKTPHDIDNDENSIIDIEEQIMQSGIGPQETVSDRNSTKVNIQDEIARLQKELEEKNEENKKLKNHHLRALADYENLSKRTKAERLRLLKSANADLITKFLELADSIEKGTDSFSLNSVTLDAVKDGFKAIQSQFFTILKNENVERITCIGEKFDPSLHEVILVRSDSSVEEDTILEE
ncbi:MAG: nucleotide exchange factor GrpE, partial [Candidatus Hodarchaeales archaeon]